MSDVYSWMPTCSCKRSGEFYPFDVCPGYWKALIWHRKSGRVVSIDRMRDEIERGGDDLSYEHGFRLATARTVSLRLASRSGSLFSEMATWVKAQPHFLPQARAEFASEEVADGWLAAYAKSRSSTVVVTLEEFNADARRKVQLPNLCQAFDVKWITPFEMLHRLKVQLDWKEPHESNHRTRLRNLR